MHNMDIEEEVTVDICSFEGARKGTGNCFGGKRKLG